jgi:hypothetical protein
MEEFNKFFKSLIKPLILILVVSLPILYFNIVVDPYKVLLAKYPISLVEPNKQILKMKYLLKNKSKFDSFIFGSSRVNFLNPEKISNGKYYNMTYSGGIPSQHFDNIKFLYENGIKIKNLIVGIDYISFVTDPDKEIKLLHMKDYPVSLWDKILFIKTFIISRPNLTFVKSALKNNSIYYPKLYDTGVMSSELFDVNIDKNINSHIKQKRFFQPSSEYKKCTTIDKSLNDIKKIVEFSQMNNIKLTILINPTHHITYLNLNLDEYFETLIKLSGITNFYDFSGLNSIANNNYFFYETSHYNSRVGDMIIDKIFNRPNNQIPDDFGFYVTKYNVNEHITFHKKLLSNYYQSIEWPIKYVSEDNFKCVLKNLSTIQYKIEKINGLNIVSSQQPILITTPIINVSGWAIEKSNQKEIEKIYIGIEGKLFESKFGLPKSQYSMDYINQGIENSGWEVSIPVNMFKNGINELSVYFVNKKNCLICVAKNEVKLDILSSKQLPEENKLNFIGDTRLFTINNIQGSANKIPPIVINENFLNLSGWAIDSLSNSNTGGVIVSIDNHSYLSPFLFSYPYLTKIYKKLKNPDVGWGITLPCQDLINGEYELSFKILNSEKNGYYTPKQNISIFYNGNDASEVLNKLTPANQNATYNIESINDVLLKNLASPIHISHDYLKLTGWALNSPELDVAKDVLVQIDNKLYKTNYGFQRPDVAKYYKNDNYVNSGWRISLPISAIGKGEHYLTVIMLSKNNLNYYTDRKMIAFEVP